LSDITKKDAINILNDIIRGIYMDLSQMENEDVDLDEQAAQLDKVRQFLGKDG